MCGTEGGQCAAVPQQEPVQEPNTETGTHGNDPETCEACASAKKVAQVQSQIDALPEDVTAESKETAQSALSAVDEANSALTESEQAQLDMTRYAALTEKLAVLEAQVNNCAHGNAPEGCEACASEARVASVQKLIDELPDADSITLENVEEVIERMGQIDAAAMLMTDDELAALDFTKFEAAEASLIELSEQTATEPSAVWDTATDVSYLDASGAEQTCASAIVVTNSDTEWSNGWYVVKNTVTIGSRVTVSGNVHLILAEGCNLTVSGGIGVNAGNSLTIYAQSEGDSMGSLTAQNVENLYAGIGGDENYSGGAITINGGTVNATGGEQAAGIGGGGSNWAYGGGDGGSITITGGTVTATGRNGGAGIGGGQGASTSGGSGTFSTGTDGRTVIFASSISNQSGKTDGTWSGIIFENNKGTVYGNQTLNADLTIPADKNLLIPEGTTLNISGVTVTNSCKVYVDGTLTGTLSDNVYYPLNLTNCTASGDVVTYPTDGGKLYGKSGGTITLTATNISEGQMVSVWQSGDVTVTEGRFPMPAKAVSVTAQIGDIVASVTVGNTVTSYTNFQSAFNAAIGEDGSTLKLLADAAHEDLDHVDIDKALTIVLNGHTLTVKWGLIPSGKLTVDGSAENSKLVMENRCTLNNDVVNGSITLIGGRVSGSIRVTGDFTVDGTVLDGVTLDSSSGEGRYSSTTIRNGTILKDFKLTAGSDRYGSLAALLAKEQNGNYSQWLYYDVDGNEPVNPTIAQDIRCTAPLYVGAHTHSLKFTDSDDTYHRQTCTICGYVLENRHQHDNDGFCTVCDAYQPAEGDGLRFSISNAGQLFWFADYVNNSEEPEASSAWGKLQNNISIPNESKRAWTPIGTEAKPYRGVFNGNGHSISGLYFTGEVLYASLFGVAGPGSEIENLTITSIEYDVSVSNSMIAGICGVLDGGWITNCTNAADISLPHSDLNAAGICYENNGFISGCTNAGAIHAGDSAKVGGICVNNNRNISECTNTGAIYGAYAGGICADNGSPESRMSRIEDCANRGWINGSYIAGGICADNLGTVSYCYHSGSLNGGRYRGPIAGGMMDGSSCSDCYYLADGETDEIDGTMAKTAAQFASGEVAYLLRDNPSSNAASWGQTLTGENKQDYPVLNGPQVYRHDSFCPVYSNIPEGTGYAHTPSEHDSKICGVCGTALVATVRDLNGAVHGYRTLQEAFAAANGKTATITLLENVNIGSDTLTISGGNVTFEGGSYTITTAEDAGKAIEVNGGTFNFDSGTLQTSGLRQGIFISGGILNFQGGTIWNEIGSSILIGASGKANISGGTVRSVSASDGILNISGGFIDELSVTYERTSNLSGGSFRKIATYYGSTVSQLLTNGFAYKLSDGTWVDQTHGNGNVSSLDAGTGTIQVLPIPVKIDTQPVDVSFTYGDADKTLSVAASGDDIDYQWYQLTPDEGVGLMERPVGTGNSYSLSALGAGSYKYFCRLTCDGYVLDSQTVTVTVNKVIVTPPTVSDKVYNDQTQTSGVTVGEDTPYTVEADPVGTDVGTYSVTLQLKDTANYKWIDSEEAEKTIFFQITKANNGWTQEPAISGWTYGGTASVSVGKADFGTVKMEYKAKGADDTTYSTTVPTNAGSYTARFTVAATTNYGSLSQEEDFTILPKAITVTITPNGGTYGNVTAATAEINETLVGSDVVPVTLTYSGKANDGTDYNSTTAPTQAGTYTVTATIADGNYNLTGTTTAEFVVEKVTVTTPTVDSKVYNGNPQTAEVPTSERYTVTENKGGTDAGDYNVVLSLTDSSNYQWDNKGGKTTFQITKTTDNIWTQNPAIDGWTYGETANQPTGAAQFGTVKVEYKVKDAEDGSYSATVPTQAGSYTARFTVADTNNFNGLSEVKDFTIGKVSLTVKAKDHTITYGEKPANSGVEYSDFVNSEDASVLGGELVYIYSYGQYDDVGSYTITPSGLTSGNYAISYNSGKLTVNQKEIGIDWSNTQLTYNGSSQKPTATPTGLENNDDITLAVSGEETDAGTGYTAEVNAILGDKAGNYKLPSTVTTTFSIARKEVTIWGLNVETSKVYDGTTDAKISSGGFLKETQEGLFLKPGAAAYDTKDVGDNKTITFSGFALTGPASKNYTLAQPAPVKAAITPKPVTLAATVKDKDFDGTTDAEIDTVKTEGFVTGDDVRVENGTATFAYANVGTEIPVSFTGFTLTGKDSGNYSIPNPPPTVTAEIRITENYLAIPEDSELSGQTEIWVDGVAYPVQTDSGIYAALPEEGALLTIFTYANGNSQDVHEKCPTGMAVYRIARTENGATVAKIDALDDLLQYSGCSIRITGKRGIRMITALTKETKNALKGAGLAGYTLEEYGTVVQWADELGDQSLTLSTGKSNYAYKKGAADPVFANVGNLTQYTNVLVWDSLTDEQLGQDIVMRPYIILKDADGNTVTLYGGCVSRSIGYIAWQNRAVFKPGTAAYKYVWDIIHAVYGDQYDGEYQG